jgi:hypothetical protein
VVSGQWSVVSGTKRILRRSHSDFAARTSSNFEFRISNFEFPISNFPSFPSPLTSYFKLNNVKRSNLEYAFRPFSTVGEEIVR